METKDDNRDNELVELGRQCQALYDQTFPPGEKWRPTCTYASVAGHACRFYLWALRARWEDFPLPDLGLRRIFAEGNLVEDAVIARLRQAGFKFTHQQVRYEEPDLGIRGRIDGYIWSEVIVNMLRDRGYNPKNGWHNWLGIPAEIKGLAASYADECTDFRAMLESERPWVRKYPAQLLLYAFMDPGDQPLVCLVIKNKGNGEVRFVFEWVEERLDYLARVGENVAAVNRHLREGTVPAPLNYSPVWCDRCDAAAFCPTMLKLKGQGKLSLSDNVELGAALEAMVSYDSARVAYARAEKTVKKILEATGNWPTIAGTQTIVVCGDYRATVTAKARSGSETPSRYLDVEKIGG